ncbi:MAG: toprim domain-containing protein [Patescibacteria group bacterium]
MINHLPEPMKRLAERLAELPSIGPRQAIRLAFYLVNEGPDTIHGLASDLENLKRIKICERCFFIHQNSGTLCSICNDPKRNHGLIALVEKETDLISIENTRRFNGRYLILDTISKTGILDEAQKLKIQNLKSFIQKNLGGQAEEILLAFNPTSHGDFHASLITKELGPLTKKISRLGRGLPTGGEIEFADDETLGAALGRRD